RKLTRWRWRSRWRRRSRRWRRPSLGDKEMNIVAPITRAIDTMNLIAKLKLIRRLVFVAFCAMPVIATGAEQKTFATPDEAVAALLAALKADDDAALVAIFGDKHRALIVTPDRAANSANRARAVAAMQTFRLLDEE